ncbi:unnamed protein product [Cylindrotheca closterium]|uniref:RING-type domain-containing protein n=1 Tax=Cylindrotheca closterium TaxID=2856 RepID=A0AAD2JN73_9STRA|nr:unnamed protein product [Cylindrotheca closterium]
MVRVPFLFFSTTTTWCLLNQLAISAASSSAFICSDDNGLTQQVNDTGCACFSGGFELEQAVRYFVVDGCSDSKNCNNWVVQKYGWPMGSWCVSNLNEMRRVFDMRRVLDVPPFFNDDISSWDVSNVKAMDYMFEGASTFNGDLSSWDVSKVTNMRGMFNEASSFNQDLTSWNTSSVTDMDGIFREASSFNGDISTWDVSKVTDMSNTFTGASSFNRDLSSWDVSSVVSTLGMFKDAKSFNQDLSSWDVSSVVIMYGMFDGASSFNGDIASWDVSGVTNMLRMFQGDSSFNQDLASWDVSSVTNMHEMFQNAFSFNQNLSSWNVSKVTNMNSMFNNAFSFNQNLSSWKVSKVHEMGRMFNGAKSFNGDLSSWDVSQVTEAENMFEGAAAFDKSAVCNWSDAWKKLIRCKEEAAIPKSGVLARFLMTAAILGSFGGLAVFLQFTWKKQRQRPALREVQPTMTLRQQQQRERNASIQGLTEEERNQALHEQFITKFNFQTVLPDQSTIAAKHVTKSASKQDHELPFAADPYDDEDAFEVDGTQGNIYQGLLRWRRPSVQDECCICLECYAAGETICAPITTGCDHVFHEGCINEWLKNNAKCPLCRVELLND